MRSRTNPPLVHLEHVHVALEGRRVLSDLCWSLCQGEHWAILGANGSGKSTFLKLIRGELWPAPDGASLRVYHLDGTPQTTAVGVKERIALVSPELQARYLQQEWTLTALQVIHSGFGGGDYVYEKLKAAEQDRALAVIRLVGVETLLARNVQSLSTGELRKILVARALAPAPQVLICDEICDGLDREGREELLRALEHIARHGTQILYATHREEEFLPVLTHRLRLAGGRVVESGPQPRHAARVHSAQPDEAARPGVVGAAAREGPGRRAQPGRTRIQIESAEVYHDHRPALRVASLTIRAGEHWGLVGPNGSGKSTLLKLIIGDVHPAWGGRVRRFDFTSRRTLWEVRRRIGWVSPELQSNYRERLTGAEVVASGFHSSVGLMLKVTRPQWRRVEALMTDLGLEALAGRSTLEMSYGEFRKILIARALVHRPELLVCDEPFDGLDATSRRSLAGTLSAVGRNGTGLIVVTHHLPDLPACTTHLIELGEGRVRFQGRVEEYVGRRTTP